MPRIMKNKKSKVAIGLDNQCALIVNDEKYEVVKSNIDAKAYKKFYSGLDFVIKELENFGKVDDLTTKQ